MMFAKGTFTMSIGTLPMHMCMYSQYQSCLLYMGMCIRKYLISLKQWDFFCDTE